MPLQRHDMRRCEGQTVANNFSRSSGTPTLSVHSHVEVGFCDLLHQYDHIPGDAGRLNVVPGSSTLSRRKPSTRFTRSNRTGRDKRLTATREEVCSTTGTLG
ncbi:hypothetical protein TRVL_09700 [Trypanosoma vivax]|nr:hypothetical protein TRVL_09700 [Trypanosoma vivax]